MDSKTLETFAHEMTIKDDRIAELEKALKQSLRLVFESHQLADHVLATLKETQSENQSRAYELERYQDWLDITRKENRALNGEIAVYRAALEAFAAAHRRPDPHHRITLHDLRVAHEALELCGG